MAEHRAVLFLAVGKAERTAHIHLDLVEIGIKPVSSERGRIQVLVCSLDDVSDHIFRCRTEHDRKHLGCEHHAHTAACHAFDSLCIVVVIAVEPGVAFAVTYDLARSDVRLDALAHFLEPGDKAFGIYLDALTANKGSNFLLIIRKNGGKF